jgi:O-succinylbenzoate synthase
MKILRDGSWRSCVEFPRGTKDALRDHRRRESLIICLRDQDGRRGLGEAAPLLNLSRESLDEVEGILGALPESWTVGDLSSLASVSDCEVLRGELPPSLRFALETALLDLGARRAGQAFEYALGGPAKERQSTARLVTEPAALDGIELEPGEAVKVKVGCAGARTEELAALRRFRARLGATVEIRLDVNGAWSPVEWAASRSELEALALAWVEDPVDPRSWIELPETNVPLALDAPLVDAPPKLLARLLQRADVAAVVLKPTLLGGLARARAMAKHAEQLGLEVVYSHAYEGPVGYSAIAAASLADAGARPAAGLGPHPGLGRFRETLERLRGQVLVPGARAGLGLEMEDLLQ